MIDVHILSIPERKGPQLDRCIDSVLAAAAMAPFPVNVHVVSCDSDGHIGRGRKKGYDIGSMPYVTNVDDDDWLEVDAFRAIESGLMAKPPALYTSFFHHTPKGVHVNKCRALLRVFHRDVIGGFDFEDWPAKDREGLVAHADRAGKYVMIDDPVYHYSDSPFSASRRATAKNPSILMRPEVIGD